MALARVLCYGQAQVARTFSAQSRRAYSQIRHRDYEPIAHQKAPLLQLRGPYHFGAVLTDYGQRRAQFVYDRETRSLSHGHDILLDMAKYYAADTRDFREHDGVFIQLGTRTRCLLGAFIHSGPFVGGVRLFDYSGRPFDDLFRDGLQLAVNGGRRASLAGLRGGAQGIIALPPDMNINFAPFRQLVLQDFSEFVNGLRGAFDVRECTGLQADDLSNMFPDAAIQPHDSSLAANGLLAVIQTVLEQQQLGGLSGKTVGVVGIDRVSEELVAALLRAGASRVLVSDPSYARTRAAAPKWIDEARVEVLTAGDGGDVSALLSARCDAVVLNVHDSENIIKRSSLATLNAKVLVAAALNQVAPGVADELREQGVCYLPHFISSRIPLLQAHYSIKANPRASELIKQHLNPDWKNSIQQTVLQVLRTASEQGTTPEQAGSALAIKMRAEQVLIPGPSVASLVGAKWWAEPAPVPWTQEELAA